MTSIINYFLNKIKRSDRKLQNCGFSFSAIQSSLDSFKSTLNTMVDDFVTQVNGVSRYIKCVYKKEKLKTVPALLCNSITLTFRPVAPT